MPSISPWVSTNRAADELGLSRRTIRRRIDEAPHWQEGRHYRWVQQPRRRVLMIHVPNAISLLRAHGW